jgi:predicted Zn finger-like uncharacterized protein
MKITCPVCHTSYVIPDTAIGAKGRNVKCASCSHNWHQDPLQNPSDAPITDISEDSVKAAAKEGANIPAIVEYAPVSPKLIAATILLFIMGSYANGFVESAEDYGYQKTGSLAFNDMDVVIKREANKLVAYISGEIINESDKEKYTLPDKLKIKLWSGQKRVMAETTYDLPDITLGPGETANLTPRIGNISGNAKKLIVDLGNDMELFFRD